MRLGLLSDTHGSVVGWNKALTYFNQVDSILHAGDILYHGPKNPLPEGYDPKALANRMNKLEIPLLISRGNCDSSVDGMVLSVPIQSPYLFTILEGYRIMVNHGDTLHEEDIQALIERYGLHFFLTGHTHIPVIKELGGGLLINPGSPSLSKYRGIQTIGLWEDGRVEIMDIDTGERLMEGELKR